MDNCRNHPETKTSKICKSCWNAFCDNCLSGDICLECASKSKKEPAQVKKPGFKVPLWLYVSFALIVILSAIYLLKITTQPLKEQSVAKKKQSNAPREKHESYVLRDDGIEVSAPSKNIADSVHGLAVSFKKSYPSYTSIKPGPSLIKIKVFNNSSEYVAETGKPSWSQGYSDVKRRTIFVVADFQDNSVVVHELSHLFFYDYIRFETPHTVWIDEGLAVLQQIKYDSVMKQSMRQSLQIVKEGKFTPLRNLGKINIANTRDKDEVNQWYAQCASTVFFLENKFGNDKFRLLLRNLHMKQTFEKSVTEIYGIRDINNLQRQWFNDLKQSKAYF